MSTARFDVPDDIRDTILLLNAAKIWHLSVVRDGDRLHLYDGDQVIFTADTTQEALAFLAGGFLGTYNGKPLDQIKDEVASGRFNDSNAREANAEIHRERRALHS